MDSLPDELIYRIWYEIEGEDLTAIYNINRRTKSLSENVIFWSNKVTSIWPNYPFTLRQHSVLELKCLYKSLSKSGVVYTFVNDGNILVSKTIPCLQGFNNIWQISWEQHHAAFITNTGQLYTVGRYDYRRLRFYDKEDIIPVKFTGFDNVIQVSCGREHTAFLTVSGEVYTFGCDDYDQLGYKYPPTKILDNIKQIACGYNRTAFVTYGGELYTSGRSIPDKISLPPNIKIKQVSCGNHHTVFITQSGQIYSFSDSTVGQLEITPIPGFDNVVQVSCGAYHTAFITTEGKIYTFGDNYRGQLGLGDNELRHKPTPIPGYGEPNCPKILQVSCGYSDTIFITDRGQVYTCGYNNAIFPTPITGFTKVYSISAGIDYDSCISKNT